MRVSKFIFLTILISILGLTIYYFYPEDKIPAGVNIDNLVVYKSKRLLYAYSGDNLIKKYKISLGKSPVGKKLKFKDHKTPEGVYRIFNKKANSKYRKSLDVSYPYQFDGSLLDGIAKNAGDGIEIHGIQNGLGFVGKFQRWYDWTDGCLALTDSEIDGLYRSVKIGTRIEINP